MNHVRFRPRTSEDDQRLIKCIPPIVQIEGNVIVIPEKSMNPVVSWSREIKSGTANEKDVDAYLLNCTKWPRQTKTLCHHCCHSFDTVPVPLPMKFDSVRNVYHCRGNFCSWQCAKAYNMTVTPQRGQGNRNMNISLLAYRLWVKYKTKDCNRDNKRILNFARFNIDPAPPKEVLDVFGGDVTIDDYRKGFFGIVVPEEALVGKPFLTIRHKLHLPFSTINSSTFESKTCEIKNENVSGGASGIMSTRNNYTHGLRTIESSSVHEHSNAFCERLNNASVGNSIMKRKRQDDNKPTLFNTMGVKVKPKKK